MKSTNSSDSFAQRLLFYGIGAGALSAAATTHAAVVTTPVGQTGSTFYFTLQNTTVSTTAPSSSYFEIYTGKSKASATTSSSATTGAATNYMIATASRPGGNGGGTATNYVLKLGVGTTIGSQTFTTTGVFNNYYAGTQYAFLDGSKAGDWKPGDRGFVGLEITTGTGGIDYGFADVTVNNYNGTNTFALNGIAYDNTPGAAIGTFAIPEPGSTTALLVAGAAGAAALRARRRKA